MTTGETSYKKKIEVPIHEGAFEIVPIEQASQAFATMVPFEFSEDTIVAKLSGEKRPVRVEVSQEQLVMNDYYLAIHGRYGDDETPVSFMHLNPIFGQVAELGRPVSVGRAKDSDFKFTDALVSAKHAEISYDAEKGGGLDSASTNESYLFIVPKSENEITPDASVETIPRAELKMELGEEAVQTVAQLEQEPAVENDPEVRALNNEEQLKLDAIALDLEKVARSLHNDIETSNRLFRNAQEQLSAVRELTGMLYQEDVRTRLDSTRHIMLFVQNRLVGDLRAVFTQAENTDIDKASYNALTDATEAASSLARDAEIDDTTHKLVRTIMGTLDSIGQAKNVSKRSFDINDASGNLIAQSGQFLGRIHNLESLTGYDTVMDLQDRLAAVTRDLESYSEMLQVAQRPSSIVIEEIEQLRRQISVRS